MHRLLKRALVQSISARLRDELVDTELMNIRSMLMVAGRLMSPSAALWWILGVGVGVGFAFLGVWVYKKRRPWLTCKLNTARPE